MSTASTCGPAPMANSISVALADIDTIASGCASRVSSPSSPVTVTGNADSSAAAEVLDSDSPAAEPPPQAVSTRERGRRSPAARDRRDVTWNMESLREGGGSIAHERTQRSMRDPCREGRIHDAGQAIWLRFRRTITVAGQRRDSTGLRCRCVTGAQAGGGKVPVRELAAATEDGCVDLDRLLGDRRPAELRQHSLPAGRAHAPGPIRVESEFGDLLGEAALERRRIGLVVGH